MYHIFGDPDLSLLHPETWVFQIKIAIGVITRRPKI